jgi:hypothetical protein
VVRIDLEIKLVARSCFQYLELACFFILQFLITLSCNFFTSQASMGPGISLEILAGPLRSVMLPLCVGKPEVLYGAIGELGYHNKKKKIV